MMSEGRDRTETQRYFAEYVVRELVGHLGVTDAGETGATLAESALHIERLSNGTYRIGEAIVDDIAEIEGAVSAVKAPLSIVALRMSEPFKVISGEEVMRGGVGDWVLKGVMGEVYACPAAAFALSYRIATA
jgi:hypothetical protein